MVIHVIIEQKIITKVYIMYTTIPTIETLKTWKVLEMKDGHIEIQTIAY